jgi:hypothetical protein
MINGFPALLTSKNNILSICKSGTEIFHTFLKKVTLLNWC